MNRFKVGDKVQKVADTENQLFEIVDFVGDSDMTCVIFKPLQSDSQLLVEMYADFEVNYELYTEDDPITDLYILLIDSSNGKAQQLFFTEKRSAIFFCVDLLKQSASKVCDLTRIR